MSARQAEALRQLVRDHYHGLLTFESYRAQRGVLLDGLRATDAEPERDEDEITISRRKLRLDSKAPLEQPAADQPPTGGGRMRAGLVSAASLVFVAVGVGAYYYWSRPGVAPEGSTPEPIAEEVPSMGPSGEDLFGEFVERGDWSADSLANLGLAWDALAQDVRAETSGSLPYQRFANALQRRVREERALSISSQTDDLVRLLELAVRLELPFAAELRMRSSIPRPDAVPPEPAPADEPETTEPSPATEAPEDTATESTVHTEPATPGEPAESEFSIENEAETIVGEVEASVVTESSELRSLSAAASQADPCPADLVRSRRPFCRDQLSDGTSGPPLVMIPAGQFDMGSDDAPDRRPVHVVTLSQPFAMSAYEVSYSEYSNFCSARSRACPERAWDDGEFPVVLVSWHDAVAYTEWLSEQTGFAYRLPSEAEWEYAARAGTDTPFPFGTEITPSSARSSVLRTVDSPLARGDRSVNPNDFRLMHMIGNVREWVADSWHDDYTGAPANGDVWDGPAESDRVVRGGSFVDVEMALRSASRAIADSAASDRVTGFRVVREVSN